MQHPDRQPDRALSSPAAPRRKRTFAWIALAWLVVSIGSAAINVVSARSGADVGAAGALLKAVNNLEFLIAFPGYLIVWMLSTVHGQPEWRTAVPGAAVGWLLVFVGAWFLLSARRWILARIAPRSASDTADRSGGADASHARSMDRRRMLGNVAMCTPAVLAPAALAYATVIEPRSLRISSYRVPIRGLPAPLDGLRLVQISDTHYGPRVASDFIAEVVQRAIDLKPDVFLLTGDYVYDGNGYIQHAAKLFRPLVSGPGSRPTLATLGNHDWYAGGELCARELASIGIRMIDNARVFLDADSRAIVERGRPGHSLCIAGLGDLIEDHIDPHAALGGVHPDIPRLVLAHNPDTAEESRVTRGPRIDLMLSGHTHGGQCRLPLLGTPITLSRYGQKYNGGIARAPSCPVLVSRGIGTSILPIRFNVPPELVELTLIAAN